jgi:hypothetical protein
MADSEPVAAMVLDRLVPTFQAAEPYVLTVAAPVEWVWAALAEVTVGELGLFRLLMGARMLPGRLLGSPRARCWTGRFASASPSSPRTPGGSW